MPLWCSLQLVRHSPNDRLSAANLFWVVELFPLEIVLSSIRRRWKKLSVRNVYALYIIILYLYLESSKCLLAMSLFFHVWQRRELVIALLLLLFTFYLLKAKPHERAQPTNSHQQSQRRGRRSLCICTNRLIVNLQPGAAPIIIKKALDQLINLSATSDVYLITQLDVDSDAREKEVMAALVAANLFGPDRLDRRKLLFCATEDGRCAICRQLEPTVHIETSSKVATYLAPHLHRVLLVQPGATSPEQQLSSMLTEAHVILSPHAEMCA